ncbi:hypothetical protein LEN26_010641 [Aphanomyces euteiches]|nr:hypothetical protein AeMF1_015375 [Aphanomyces euteiches]KAH9121491.1 hypothetical protein LEN26_010641 [Aphanomyces euteiches]KAH9192895.1 hypothetical protein AeNC1_005132 [Aphanomyces euteiches]
MEHCLSALRSTESKIRLTGVSYAEPFLDNEGWEEILTALVSCLSDNNAKLAQSSLKMLTKLVATKTPDMLRSYFPLVWSPLKEKMGDSKAPVREAANELVLEFIDKLGMSATVDRLKLCTSHKNWRTREQVLVCIVMAMDRFQNDPLKVSLDGLLDMALKLLEDSAKEVRNASTDLLESLYKVRGHTLLNELQNKHIRSTHMRALLTRFGADEVTSNVLTSMPPTPPKRSSSIHSSPSRTKLLPSSAPPPTSSTGSIESIPPPISCQFSDRELTSELQRVTQGLTPDSEWSRRVEAMQRLQALVAGGAALQPIFASTLRQLRETLCEQVGDLRSAVLREACTTIAVIANAMGDAFNTHAEFFVAALLKSTIVTIQIIAVSADSCLKSIVRSTQTGYPKVMTKLIDGARSRNQVLRLHCVDYLTMAFSLWHVVVLERAADSMAALLPHILCDAQADVRLAARRCFWSFHRIFEARAESVRMQLDSSTQRRLQEDVNMEGARNVNPVDLTSFDPPANSLAVARPPSFGPRRVEAQTESSVVATAPISGPARVLNRKIPIKQENEAPKSMPGPLRVLAPPPKPSSLASTVQESTTFVGAKRVEAKISAINAPSKLKEQPPVSSGAKRTLSSEFEPKLSTTSATTQKDPPAVSSTKPLSLRVSDNLMGSQASGKEEVSIISLLEKADDTIWSTRLEAMEQLVKLAVEGRISDTTRLVKIVHKRLGDTHYRIVQAALKLLEHLLVAAPNLLRQPANWKPILPKCFSKMVDPKEGVRNSASTVLDGYLILLEPNALATAVATSMLDGIPVKVKAVVFQFLLKLVPTANDFFSNGVLLRSLLLKIAQYLEQENVGGAAAELALALYKLYKPTMQLVESQVPLAKMSLLQKCYQSPSQATSLKRKPTFDIEEEPQDSRFDLELNRLASLLRDNNKSTELKVETVREALPLIKSQDAVNYLVDLVPALLDLMVEKSESNVYEIVQSKILLTIKALLEQTLTVQQLQPLIRAVLERTNNSSLLGLYFIEKVLTLVLEVAAPVTQTRMLIDAMQHPQISDAQLQIALKTLRFALNNLSVDALRPGEFDLIFASVLPGLTHSKSGVRKNTVWCLVSLYFLGGSDACANHFDKMSPHHRKLVSLYIDKAQATRDEPMK